MQIIAEYRYLCYSHNSCAMKDNAKLVKLEYLQPLAEEYLFASEVMVCTSPIGGGLEDTEEGDFNF